MLHLSLFRKPTLGGDLIAAFAVSVSLFSLLTYLVLYLQNELGLSVLGTACRTEHPGHRACGDRACGDRACGDRAWRPRHQAVREAPTHDSTRRLAAASAGWSPLAVRRGEEVKVSPSIADGALQDGAVPILVGCDVGHVGVELVVTAGNEGHKLQCGYRESVLTVTAS
jgi:hypothetical protein